MYVAEQLMLVVRFLPVLLCLIAPSSGWGQPAPSAKRIVLAPHRAVYDLALEKSSGGSPLASVQGRLVYELTGSACSGYTQNMRFVTRSTNNEGEVTLSDQRTSTWEDGAGTQFRFSSSQYRDQELTEQAAGTAWRGAADGDIKVELARPEPKQIAIAAKALFPVQHSIAVIDAARKGVALFTSDFYDGAENGQKSYLTTAAIGRPVRPGFNKSLPRIANAERLDAVAAWPVSLSYFEQAPDTKDAVPAYEMSFVFFDNGVTRRLFIDNGEYSMRGKLSELTFLEAERCSQR
jgi:hypothetical protein